MNPHPIPDPGRVLVRWAAPRLLLDQPLLLLRVHGPDMCPRARHVPSLSLLTNVFVSVSWGLGESVSDVLGHKPSSSSSPFTGKATKAQGLRHGLGSF